MAPAVRICMVCWGNICRSPTAEAVLQALLAEQGLADRVEVDSAATSSEELGRPPDPRACAEAARRGLQLEHVAWRFEPSDFDRFDLVLAADEVNAERLRRRARDASDRAKIRLLRELDPAADRHDLDIADPWYGGPEGFRLVYDQIEAACRGLVDELRAEHGW